MIIIRKRNVYSQLSDYTPELENKLAIAHENYWFSPRYKQDLWDGKTHFLKVPSLKIPTGLLFIVTEYFRENNMPYKIIDDRKKPDTFFYLSVEENKYTILTGIKLRDYQKEAIEQALCWERGVLELATGSGKTEIAIAITKLLGLKTLFIVHTQDLLRQTRERFEKRLDLKGKIGIIGEGKFEVDSDIVIATIQSLDRRLFEKNEKGNSILNKKTGEEMKKFLNTFDVMFQDETHHSSATTWYRMGMFMHNAYYRFGLSGTPLRRDVLSNMKVMAITGPSIYERKSIGLIKDGYLSNIKMEIIACPTIYLGKDWQEIYDNGIVHSLERNSSICEIAIKHFKQGKKVMVLVRRIKHGEILEQMCVAAFVPAIFLKGSDSADHRVAVKELFSEKNDFILIASTIFDEGVDIPEVNVLIIAAGGKSEVKTIQRVGRGLRKKKVGGVLVYDFNDYSKFLNKHSINRIKVYQKEGFLK